MGRKKVFHSGDTIHVGDDCRNCVYMNEIDKLHIVCKARNKTYVYGQSIICEDRKEE